jgi:hypothetical protein
MRCFVIAPWLSSQSQARLLPQTRPNTRTGCRQGGLGSSRGISWDLMAVDQLLRDHGLET